MFRSGPWKAVPFRAANVAIASITRGALPALRNLRPLALLVGMAFAIAPSVLIHLSSLHKVVRMAETAVVETAVIMFF